MFNIVKTLGKTDSCSLFCLLDQNRNCKTSVAHKRHPKDANECVVLIRLPYFLFKLAGHFHNGKWFCSYLNKARRMAGPRIISTGIISDQIPSIFHFIIFLFVLKMFFFLILKKKLIYKKKRTGKTKEKSHKQTT